MTAMAWDNDSSSASDMLQCRQTFVHALHGLRAALQAERKGRCCPALGALLLRRGLHSQLHTCTHAAARSGLQHR